MAKYKFTKTFKISEGICIDADGTVTKLPESFVLLANKPVVKKSNLKNTPSTRLHIRKSRLSKTNMIGMKIGVRKDLYYKAQSHL